MGKKVKEYKSGDFIFAKVKGYPAWPARVQKLNGKKYFVYFYGTGETANLPPNMIFDYAENKDKFLSKAVKRRDFNDGVKQIEHDFANNVPLEAVIGVPMEVGIEADTSANDSAMDTTADETINDTANETAGDTADDTLNTTQNDAAVEDSDETGALVIDEGGKGVAPKGRKSKAEPKPPATPKAAPKTPRGKGKKDEKVEEVEDEKKEEEIVSRSGRKIRPKRYIDEQTEDNTTLPSPAPKKRRAPSPDKDKQDKEKDKQDKEKDKQDKEKQEKEKNINHFNAVTQSELEELKEPFKSEDPEKDNILIAYLPTTQYVGIRLFTARPTSFKSEASRLQWDKQAASNAITLKMQLERGQISPQSIQAQLVLDLSLSEEEKATLDKERETEEKKSRVQFLKSEMKLIELDAKIKTCLCLEKADTDMCLKLLDELVELDVKPLMLLKHPSCLETVKRMRAYVGNTPSWDLSENDALLFSKQAHKIRKQADTLYRNMKELFITPEGLSFWEYFSERVLQFKKATSKLNAAELLEMVHEPIELSQPSAVTMRSAIAAAADEEPPVSEDEPPIKKTKTPQKAKKPPPTPKGKRNTRKQQIEEKDDKIEEEEGEKEKQNEATKKSDKGEGAVGKNNKSEGNEKEKTTKETQKEKDKETIDKDKEQKDKPTEQKDKPSEQIDKSTEEKDKSTEKKNKSTEQKDKATEQKENSSEQKDKSTEQKDKSTEQKEKSTEQKDKSTAQKDKSTDQKDTNSVETDTNSKEKEPEKEKEIETEANNTAKDTEKGKEQNDTQTKGKAKNGKDKVAEEKDKVTEEEDKIVDEPRAKRSRAETKKTEPPPPRSPAKRKSKF